MSAKPFPLPIAPEPTPVTPGLTPAQEQVIALVAVGLSIRKIADAVNIHRNTIGNWRRTIPAFAHALTGAQYDRVLYWRDVAEEHAALAIETIADILHDRHAPPSVRLRAALAMLQHATTLPPAEPPAPVPEPSVPDQTSATWQPPEPVAPPIVQPTSKTQKVAQFAQAPTAAPPSKTTARPRNHPPPPHK